jgi:hypothetical protein
MFAVAASWLLLLLLFSWACGKHALVLLTKLLASF